jgi:hypothetical protein
MMIDNGGGMEISVTKDELGLILVSVGWFLQIHPKLARSELFEGVFKDKDSVQVMEDALKALYTKLKETEGSQ